jgi:hypothetical protein
MRDGRATVTLSLDGGMCELRMMCRRLANASTDIPLAFFEGELIKVRIHKAPYAAVSGGGHIHFARAAVRAAAMGKTDRCDEGGDVSQRTIRRAHE